MRRFSAPELSSPRALSLVVELGRDAERVERVARRMQPVGGQHRPGQRQLGDRRLEVEAERERADRAVRDPAPPAADLRRAGRAAGAVHDLHARLRAGGLRGNLQLVGDRGTDARSPDPGARRGERGDPSEDLVELELAVAAGSDHGHRRVQASSEPLRAGQHHGIAERASEPRLGAGRDRVAADVGVDDEIAAEQAGGRADALRDAGGPVGDVDEHGRGAEVLGDVGFGEAHSLRRRGVGPGQHRVASERVGADDLAHRPRSGNGVDRQPLPGDAAEDERRGERLAAPAERERADDVAAAADPEHQYPSRPRDALVE